MIRGTYTGPHQGVSLEGQDYQLVPGASVELPPCDYVETLVANGLLTLAPELEPAAASLTPAKPKKEK